MKMPGMFLNGDAAETIETLALPAVATASTFFHQAKDSSNQCPMCHGDSDCGRCQKCEDSLCVDDYEMLLRHGPGCIVDNTCRPLCPWCCQVNKMAS